MTTQEFEIFMDQGRREGTVERNRRGIVPPPLGGIVVPAGLGAAAPAAAPAAGSYWVLAEMVEGHRIGECVVIVANFYQNQGYGLRTIIDSAGKIGPVFIKEDNYFFLK